MASCIFKASLHQQLHFGSATLKKKKKKYRRKNKQTNMHTDTNQNNGSVCETLLGVSIMAAISCFAAIMKRKNVIGGRLSRTLFYLLAIQITIHSLHTCLKLTSYSHNVTWNKLTRSLLSHSLKEALV